MTVTEEHFIPSDEYKCLYRHCDRHGPADVVVIVRTIIPGTDLERQAHVPVHEDCFPKVFITKLNPNALKGSKQP